MKLLIRNLSRRTTEATLKTLFEAHGTVKSCVVVMDQKTGESKGFAFILMPNPGQAKAAMKSLNNKDIEGSRIRVKKAEDRKVEESTTEDKQS